MNMKKIIVYASSNENEVMNWLENSVEQDFYTDEKILLEDYPEDKPTKYKITLKVEKV